MAATAGGDWCGSPGGGGLHRNRSATILYHLVCTFLNREKILPTPPVATMSISARPPTSAPVQWLCGDLHTHCEDAALVSRHLARAGRELDFIALTNHPHKPGFLAQEETLARAREAAPGLTVFFGLEWNAPGGHTCVLFPPSPDETTLAYDFARSWDLRLRAEGPTLAGAMAWLNALPPAQRPVVFFNHPTPGYWSPETVDAFRRLDTGGMVCGIEAVLGHQGRTKAAAWNPDTFAGCAAGGLADHLYGGSGALSLLANSDFHVHRQDREFDFPPGLFKHTRVTNHSPVAATRGEAAAGGGERANLILAALRTGCTCAAQGHWLELTEFSIGAGAQWAHLGDRWPAAGDAALCIAFESDEELARVEVIGRLGAGPDAAALVDFGPQPAGAARFEWPVPAGSAGHLRLRVISADRRRPEPRPEGVKVFLTSAIHLGG